MGNPECNSCPWPAVTLMARFKLLWGGGGGGSVMACGLSHASLTCMR